MQRWQKSETEVLPEPDPLLGRRARQNDPGRRKTSGSEIDLQAVQWVVSDRSIKDSPVETPRANYPDPDDGLCEGTQRNVTEQAKWRNLMNLVELIS